MRKVGITVLLFSLKVSWSLVPALTHQPEEEAVVGEGPVVPAWMSYFTDQGAVTDEEINEALSGQEAGSPVPSADYVLAETDIRWLKRINQLRKKAAWYRDLSVAKEEDFIKVGPFVPHMGQHYSKPGPVLTQVPKWDQPYVLTYTYHKEGEPILAGVEYSSGVPAKLFGVTDWPVHHGAAHYSDGSEIYLSEITGVPPEKHPDTGATLVLWHPDIYTLHLWFWVESPGRMFSNSNQNIPDRPPG